MCLQCITLLFEDVNRVVTFEMSSFLMVSICISLGNRGRTCSSLLTMILDMESEILKESTIGKNGY